MIIPLMRYGSAARNMPKYEYTGSKPLFLSDSQGNWELVFLADCTITFSKLPGPVEAFLVGGGAKAGLSEGYAPSGYAKGGDGGRGGGTLTASPSLQAGVQYPVVIGQSGTSTAAFGLTAGSGQGAYGGAGAQSSAAGNGSDGVLAFGTGDTLYENGTPIRFGASGGGGAARGDWNHSLLPAGSGGATGGGDGGAGDGSETATSRDGKPNTGGGGGGGSRNNTRYSEGNFPSPGRGGSGIVILRNARSNT